MQKLAVVTGASGGIGAAICQQLANDGFDIVAQYRTGKDRATQLANAVAATGRACYPVRADLARSDGVDSLIRNVDDIVGATEGLTLQALVNNAAILLGPSFEEATPDEFDRYVAINLRAPFFLARGLVSMMQRGASIVNVSSASAHIASAGDLVYAMTKAGLESLTRNVALSVAERGIRVNAVIPGFTDNGNAAFADHRTRAYMSSLSALGDVSEPVDVARAVSFLVSDQSRRTTGATLDVSGGMTLSPRPHAGSVRELL